MVGKIYLLMFLFITTEWTTMFLFGHTKQDLRSAEKIKIEGELLGIREERIGFKILLALYGKYDIFQNVTDAVTKLIKTLNGFIINNSDLETDPLAHVHKDLFLVYSKDGEIKYLKTKEHYRIKFEAGELSVNPTQDSKNVHPEDELKILSATYVWKTGQTDVTAGVKNIFDRRIFSWAIDPGNFGIEDPAKGTQKNLKIHYKLDGKEMELSKPDGEIINFKNGSLT